MAELAAKFSAPSPPAARASAIRSRTRGRQRREPLLPSPWGRWRGAVPWHCTVTDEGSPLTAGLTSARTLANSVHGAAAPSAPSEGFGFRAPPVAETARRQAAAVRKCKANAAARAAGGEGTKLDFTAACGNKRLRERIPDQLTLCHLG